VSYAKTSYGVFPTGFIRTDNTRAEPIPFLET